MIHIDKLVQTTPETPGWKRVLVGTTAMAAVGTLSACEEAAEQDRDKARVQVCVIEGESKGDIAVLPVDEARSRLYTRNLQHPTCSPAPEH